MSLENNKISSNRLELEEKKFLNEINFQLLGIITLKKNQS